MKILLVNQCFYPDVVSAGQHLTDLAVELSGRGHQVTVISSRRGYDDPRLSFPARERWSGIDIRRVPVLGLGKKSKLRRAADFLSFYVSCFVQMLSLPRQDLLVMMTSPPLIAFAGALVRRLRGGRLAIWIMDLNPDEAIAAGVLRPRSLPARLLEWLLRASLRGAQRIIVLDRFMQERVVQRDVPPEKISIVPPWSHDEAIAYDVNGRNQFRRQHHCEDKLVVMYSGNHSPCHPLDTLLGAAERLRTDDRVRFCFIGGGSEFRKVQQFAAANRLGNILCLPYQPLNQVSASLSAADLQVVVMGEPYPGIKHPCKIYNIVALGIPFIFIGPDPSHVSDLVRKHRLQDAGLLLRHGDVEELVSHVAKAASQVRRPPFDHSRIAGEFSQRVLVPALADILEAEDLGNALQFSSVGSRA